MTDKCGNYSGSGKNPLSESSINENGDRGDRTPKYPDYAGGRTGKTNIDPDLKYVNSGDGDKDD